MIRFATPQMEPALQEIWHTCFGDDREYIRLLFQGIVRPERVLVHCGEDGEPQAMLCLQPAELAAPSGQSCRCAYIFGVATLPQARGKGLSTALLESAHKQFAAGGYALSTLVPASQSLHEFYGQRGYEPCFSLMKLTVSGQELLAARQPCVLTVARLEAQQEPRDRFFGSSALYLRWNREYLEQIGRECAFLGGQVLRFACQGQQGYAVCYQFGDVVVVKEITADGPVLHSVLAALHRRFGAREYRVYLRAGSHSEFTNSVLPFGLVRWYDKEIKARFLAMDGAPAYLAHVLD